MPLSLLAALLMAFGYDSGGAPVPVGTPVRSSLASSALGGVGSPWLSYYLGGWTASRVAWRGYAARSFGSAITGHADSLAS